MAVDKNKITAEATKLVQKGQWDKAIRTYEKILIEDPKDVRVLLKVGELHQKKGDNASAADAFNRVADAYGEQGFFLKAVAVYKQVIKLSPEDVRVNERLAGLYQQLGLMSDAMAQLQLVASAHEKAGDASRLTDVLRRMVEIDADNIASNIKLGELYAKGGKTRDSLEQFRKAADYLKRNNRIDEYVRVAERIAYLAPDDLALTKELANIYLSKADTKRALAKLQLCFKVDPKDIETLNLLAQAFRDLGQVSKTVSVLKELAHVYADGGKNDAARATYRNILELAPDDPDALEVLGPAMPVRAAAPRARPPPPPPVQAVAPPPPAPSGPAKSSDGIAKLLIETDVYVKYGLHDKALEHLKQIFALDSDNPDAHEKARDIRFASGDRGGAMASALAAARACVSRHLTARAQAAVLRLRELAPNHPELATLSAQAGLRQALELGPERTLADDEVLLVPEPEQAESDELALRAAAGQGDEEIVQEEPTELVADELPLRAPPVEKKPARPAWPPPPGPAAKPAPAPSRPPDLADELEEVEFYVQQGLLDEARDALQNLLSAHPGHRAVQAKLEELDRKGAKPKPARTPPPASERAPAPSADQSFDIARELAEEIGEPEPPLSADEEFQYSVEDVFSQFKKGVEKTVKPEDSQTHYDLGIAYKEMGLLDDAIHEFETALAGPDRTRMFDCLTMIGLSQMLKGDPAAAAATFRKALRSEGLTGDAAKALHYELAAAYEATGDPEAALYCFQKIRKADPKYRDVNAQVSRLGGGPGRPPKADLVPAGHAPGNGTAPKPAPAAPRAGAPPEGKSGPKKNIGYV